MKLIWSSDVWREGGEELIFYQIEEKTIKSPKLLSTDIYFLTNHILVWWKKKTKNYRQIDYVKKALWMMWCNSSREKSYFWQMGVEMFCSIDKRGNIGQVETLETLETFFLNRFISLAKFFIVKSNEAVFFVCWFDSIFSIFSICCWFQFQFQRRPTTNQKLCFVSVCDWPDQA